MKIISSGKVLNSPGFYKKKKLKERIQLALILIGVLVLVSSFVYLTRHERFMISEVEVLEKNAIDTDEIIEATKSVLSGNYLWLIPRSSAFVYPSSKIEAHLLASFPRLKSVKLELSDMKKLTVSVSEREPFALYCANALHPATASECYFLDEEGLIFADAPSFSGVTYFVFATEDPIENPIGERFLPLDEFSYLLNFIENLTTLNIKPLALGFSGNEYSLFLPNGGQITLKKDDDFASVYSNLTAFLTDEAIKSQPNFLDKILYLDLRTKDKVRWKFQE